MSLINKNVDKTNAGEGESGTSTEGSSAVSGHEVNGRRGFGFQN